MNFFTSSVSDSLRQIATTGLAGNAGFSGSNFRRGPTMPKQFVKVPTLHVLFTLDDSGVFFRRDCPFVIEYRLGPLTGLTGKTAVCLRRDWSLYSGR
jgi:hypothetical protein